MIEQNSNKPLQGNTGQLSEPLQVDARGMRCPLPLLKAKLAINSLPVGGRVCILATDAGSVRDFHAFVELSENTMVSFVETAEGYTYLIQKN